MRILIVLLCLFSCGCISSVPVLIRRGIVGNDWVYVKEENKLYKRYILRGVMLIGNEKLKSVGTISHNNDKIVIYGNYEKAMESGQFIVDEDSQKYIPKLQRED